MLAELLELLVQAHAVVLPDETLSGNEEYSRATHRTARWPAGIRTN